jgi:hypothetical protein
VSRPALGKLEVGQEVIVRRAPNDMRRRPDSERYIPAVVTKVGRVWAEMEKPGSGEWSIYRWRMRMDDQHEGSDYSGSNASFATPEQHAYDETVTWARGYLKDQGIRLEPRSVWADREVELADLLSKGVDTSQSGR